jgi:hypothetical protein|tara:strand:+ start:8659 stop:10584 length:1926 start_codon:yes stop_codon:yes gene_type:complete
MIDPMNPTSASTGGDGPRVALSSMRDPGLLVALALLWVGSAVALSIDVPRTGFGIKGDEATYVAMALSVAYDGDLVYERGDIERFFEIYGGGPEGIYLKIGARSSYDVDGTFPFIHRETYPDGRDGRLYFGKAYMSSLFAAPFVWVAGLNGLLWFNVVLLSAVVFGAYRFVAARSPGHVALVFVLAFLGASIVPLYVVWLQSEIFHFAFVFFAYLLWFYKDVAPAPTTWFGRWLRSPGSDLVAAVILGLVIFSKPWPHPLFIAPPVLHLWRQRRFRHGIAVGFLAAGVSVAALGLNALISGEFIYQGGLDRKYVGGEFPFEAPGVEFDDVGTTMTTDSIVVEATEGPVAFLTLLFHNLRYFLVGRHFGFIPFFFPGVVVLLLFLRGRAEAQLWHWLILATVVLAAVTLAVYMPFTWSGGGGPNGNRYYLSVYPLFLFLTPTLRGHGPAIAAWLGGSLFTAQMLLNPFVTANQPYLAPMHGLFRLLPVELTMVRDLPIMLDPRRSRVIYGEDPVLELYFLDENASLPESPGIWVAGERRTDIIVRHTNPRPLETITVTARSGIATEVAIDIGGRDGRITLEPDVPGSVTIRPRGIYSRRSWAYLMQVTTSAGFVPRLVEAGSDDERYLGAAISLTAVPTQAQ